ncbi:uncharacterized protein [Pseudorasbora parva]|uniref:uncharacterized protein n=1 Tax=Pseudorasbora parva TaxID=51549 RepID=UPI00351ECBC9
MVDDVSRMLRYIQPSGDEVSLDFLLKSTETKDYLTQLRRADMGPATILNYIKNMIRYERFQEGKKSLQECQAVLRKAKKDMLSVYGRLLEGDHVASEGKTMFCYYCEAILILSHFQRPGAVEAITTEEWDNRKHSGGKVCVAVSEHNTVTMQIAVFALTIEEAAMLDTYCTWIHPDSIRPDVDNTNRLFVLPSGTEIRSATNDLSRLHQHYKLPNIKSQQIRRTVETDVAAIFTEELKASPTTWWVKLRDLQRPECGITFRHLGRHIKSSYRELTRADDARATANLTLGEKNPSTRSRLSRLYALTAKGVL